MATTGVVNGTSIGIYVGGTKIAKATSGSVSVSHSPRDATSKDSSAWSESLEGLREWSMDVEGLFAFDAAYGIVDLEGVLTARTAVTVRFSTESSSDEYFEGTAICTELSADSGVEESATFSASFQGTGALNFKALT
jgi:predicted secreted protein|tara:strand:- start:291 stop:701 length:411 start_codon:yes stop_codon:yes gene_type:complete